MWDLGSIFDAGILGSTIVFSEFGFWDQLRIGDEGFIFGLWQFGSFSRLQKLGKLDPILTPFL